MICWPVDPFSLKKKKWFFLNTFTTTLSIGNTVLNYSFFPAIYEVSRRREMAPLQWNYKVENPIMYPQRIRAAAVHITYVHREMSVPLPWARRACGGACASPQNWTFPHRLGAGWFIWGIIPVSVGEWWGKPVCSHCEEQCGTTSKPTHPGLARATDCCPSMLRIEIMSLTSGQCLLCVRLSLHGQRTTLQQRFFGNL